MKTFARIMLAVLFSPIWVPSYLLLFGIVAAAVLMVNLVLFIDKGEMDNELWGQIKNIALWRNCGWGKSK